MRFNEWSGISLCDFCNDFSDDIWDKLGTPLNYQFPGRARAPSLVKRWNFLTLGNTEACLRGNTRNSIFNWFMLHDLAALRLVNFSTKRNMDDSKNESIDGIYPGSCANIQKRAVISVEDNYFADKCWGLC